MAVIALVGCSEYGKLLKSKDRDLIYAKALEYYKAHKYQKAITLFEEIDPYFSGTSRGDTVKFYTCASYYNQGDFEASGMLIDQFRRSYGRTSPFSEEAEFMYAMGYYYSSPAPERDQSNTLKALMAIGEYLDRYPGSVKKDVLQLCVEELQGKLYDKEFLNAKCYYTIGRYKSAVVALKNAIAQSPESPHLEEMMYLVARSGYLLAENSVHSLQKDRYLKMMDYCLNFMSEFPESKHSKEMGKMMDDAKQYLAKHNTENQDNIPAQHGTEKK